MTTSAVSIKASVVHSAVRPISNRAPLIVRRPTIVRTGKTGNSVDVDQVVKDLSDRWEKVEDKTSVILYGSGSVILLWLASTIVGAISSFPLLPKLMELVGLSYTAWFTY